MVTGEIATMIMTAMTETGVMFVTAVVIAIANTAITVEVMAVVAKLMSSPES